MSDRTFQYLPSGCAFVTLADSQTQPRPGFSHHGVTPIQVRQFRKDVCCEHEWSAIRRDDARPDVHVCYLCGAACVRDKDGTIEEYEAAVTC